MRFVLALLFSCSLMAGMIGCGCREDPRKAPDFRHETLQDPGKIDDPPSAMSPRQKPQNRKASVQ